MKISIESNIRDYEAYIEENLDCLDQYASSKDTFFIVDQNVAKHHSLVIEKVGNNQLFLLDAIEENKTIDYAFEIYDFLISSNAKKNITIVSIGGGITQDVTGFVASTLYRGVGWIYFPTTFLAMTDSCIGSKTSINYKTNKNLLGSFYPPHKIHIYTEFLATLPRLDFYSGVGESIKLQIMKEDYPKDVDKVIQIIDELKHEAAAIRPILLDNLNVKIDYISNDEFDQGRRNLLNYGHCLGHALESTSNYYVPHGIAVTIGMIYANFLSVRRGLLSSDTAAKMNQSLFMPNIPLELRKSDFEQQGLLAALKKDKKRIGKHLTSVIPNEKLELIIVNDITDGEFMSTTQDMIDYIFS